MGLSLFAAPSVEPVTLGQTKASLRINHDDSDADIQGLIAAARFRIERVTGRQLMLATWDLKLDDAPCDYGLQIPKPPLVSVTSVSYVDTAGVTQVWAASNYQVDAPAGPAAQRGRLQPAYATNWPVVRSDTVNAFIVRFQAGYGSTETSVPEDIRRAAILFVKGWYDDDDVALTRGRALLAPYQMFD